MTKTQRQNLQTGIRKLRDVIPSIVLPTQREELEGVLTHLLAVVGDEVTQ